MKRYLPLFAFAICFGTFALGLAQLFRLRFEGGDIYPPYSSLRADPLGVMALYEALERMPEITVRRDFSANNRLPEGKNTTYLHLAAQTHQWEWISDEEFKTLEDFVTGGGRLVVAFFPETSRPFHFPLEANENDSAADKKKKTGPPPLKGPRKKAGSKQSHHNSLKDRWGLELGFRALEPDGDTFEPAKVDNRSGLPLPETLAWHSATIFTNVSSAWSAIYVRGTNPVVVQRTLGAGTVIMASDCYFFSNEALRKSRRSELLAWWLGPSAQVVFDEGHFGILETEGVATLLRKYRLYGLVAALIVLAVLFIWKNALSFVPPWRDVQLESFVPGKDVSAGFVNLLRRNIPARNLLAVCFTEWKKSARGAGHSNARQALAETALVSENARPPRERNSVAVYQEICRILKKV